MLISETSAAPLPLTRFRGLACVPEIRAREPSSARVPGVAHPWPTCSKTLIARLSLDGLLLSFQKN